jgi:hypothetical protein
MSHFHLQRKQRERAIGASLPAIICQTDAGQSLARQHLLYFLGFGVASAILVNMTVFLYFLSLHASG